MAESYGIWYASKWTGLEVTWLAGTNLSVRVAQGPTSSTHVRSLCPSKQSIVRIQIGREGDESTVHYMRLQALNA